MSNPAPSRSLILQRKLVSICALITVANLYNNTVKKSSTKYFDIKALSNPGDFPAVSVLPGPWRSGDYDESRRLKLSTATYAIYGYVRSDPDDHDEGKLDDAKDSLDQDIRNAIEMNIDSILAMDCETVTITGGDQFFSYTDQLAMFTIFVAIEYTHDPQV